MKMVINAVFDIGNINKKLILFDKDFKVVEIIKTRFEPVKDDDGFPADDLEGIKTWTFKVWQELLDNEKYEVKTLNFTTYGATLMHIDEKGEDVTPIYSYLKEFPQDLEQKFYSSYGDKVDFALETCSPPLGLLNASLQIYWLKYKKPGLYEKIKYSLHFPQYIAYLFTNEATTEYTSIGCHTAMWNFRRRDYHQWIKEENVLEKIPEFAVRPVLGYWKHKDREIPIGTGVHDTSSALRTYIYLFENSFLLLSITGTWCITLNPFDHTPLTKEDVTSDCLQYLTVQGRRIKAARFYLGNEHEYQTKRMASHYDKSEDFFKEVLFDEDIFEDVIDKENEERHLTPHYFTKTGAIRQSSPEDDWDFTGFASYEEAYHQLMYDLVEYLKPSINITAQKRFPKYLIVDGGYGKNDVFLSCMSEAYPEMTIMAAKVSEGIAMGATLFINQYLEPDMKKPKLAFKEY